MDVVIPLGERDVDIIEMTISKGSLFIDRCRFIYIVASNETFSKLEDIVFPTHVLFVEEKEFPLPIEEIMGYRAQRTGYIRQMLIKLYAFQYIPHLSEPYMVLDADMIFQRPVSFSERYMPYSSAPQQKNWQRFWDYCQRCHPSFHPIQKDDTSITGIHHHMIFHAFYLRDMFHLIESFHKKSFEHVFLESIDIDRYYDYVATEYELYFIYMNTYHSSQINLIALHSEISSSLNSSESHLQEKIKIPSFSLFCIVQHWHLRLFHQWQSLYWLDK